VSQRRVTASVAPELHIEGILEALVEADVEFLLIGGIAVGFHGYVRATQDVDVVPAPNAENLARLSKVLTALEAEVEGADEFAEGELPDPLDPAVLALGGNWVLRTKLGRFDVMQWIGDDALWERLSPGAVSTQIGDLSVRIVGYEDLVALKREAGRPEDQADLRRLSQARGEGS
jgi:predicted nucleotidyltransferase